MNIFFNILQNSIKKNSYTFQDSTFIAGDDLVPFNPKIYINRTTNISINSADISPYIYQLIDDIQNKMNINKTKPKYKNESNFSLFAQTKIKCLKQLLKNIFISKELKEKIITTFSNAQKKYFSFSNFAKLYRYKRYKTVVSNDLSLNPLDINDINTFVLIQTKSVYLFHLNDLIHIIETAITNAPNFFTEPLLPKNPYNNETFNISTLYNIYFKMKDTPRLISILFHLFFMEGFNTDLFNKKNEGLLRQTAIEKYIMNSPANTLYKSVILMLKENFYTRKLQIHNDFPKTLLVDIFRPFLLYYYIFYYDLNHDRKYSHNAILSRKLKIFYDFNNFFGRKNVKVITYYSTTKPLLTNNKKFKTTHTFNSKHISFYNINTIQFSNLYINIYDNNNDSDSYSDSDSDDEVNNAYEYNI
jgi:hypothetical protein